MGYFPADRLADVHSRLRLRNLRNLSHPGEHQGPGLENFQPSQAELLAYIPQVLVTDFAPTPLSQYEKVLKKLNDSSWSLAFNDIPRIARA
jgi:hypothetical protein